MKAFQGASLLDSNFVMTFTYINVAFRSNNNQKGGYTNHFVKREKTDSEKRNSSRESFEFRKSTETPSEFARVHAQ